MSFKSNFYKRVNGFALAALDTMNVPVGGSHLLHIHENDIATGGGIPFFLTS